MDAVLRALGEDVVVVVNIHREPFARRLGQAETLGVGQAGVLDRIDPGAQSVVDPGGAVGVRGDAQPEHVRLVDDRLHFRQAHLLRTRDIGARKHPAGGADLDHLGAIFVQLANRPPALLGRVDHRRLGKSGKPWRIAFAGVAMASGRADQEGRGNDARPDDITRLNRLLQPNVVVILRPHVAHRGEPRLEHLPGVGDPHRHPEAVGIVEALVTADPRIGVEVDVHVDQPGDERAPRQRDHRHRRGIDPDRARIGDPGDAPVVANHHRRIRDDLAGQDVDQAIGGDHHRFGDRRSSDAERGGQRQDQAGKQSSRGHRLKVLSAKFPKGGKIACFSILFCLNQRTIGEMPDHLPKAGAARSMTAFTRVGQHRMRAFNRASPARRCAVGCRAAGPADIAPPPRARWCRRCAPRPGR